MTTMTPSTNEEIEQARCCCCSFKTAVFCFSLYGVISTLLLPLTVRGQIGGQYGELKSPKEEHSTDNSDRTILFLTDMSDLHERVLISLLFIAHLIGFISMLKKWLGGLVFYVAVHIGQFIICFFWLISVLSEDIKSHLMSQYSLGWYCFFALIMAVISFCMVLVFCCEVGNKKVEPNEESPSTMLV